MINNENNKGYTALTFFYFEKIRCSENLVKGRGTESWKKLDNKNIICIRNNSILSVFCIPS